MIRERDSWQFKAITHLRGNQTPLGALLLAIIGRNAKHPPRFGPNAVISEEGYVFARFTNKRGEERIITVGKVQEFTELWSRLADDLKLDDKDRIELFRQVRQWCSVDERKDIRLKFRG